MAKESERRIERKSAHPMGVACYDCQFWYEITRSSGECRRRSPVAKISDTNRATKLNHHNAPGVWPVTDARDGCGEFEGMRVVDIGHCRTFGLA